MAEEEMKTRSGSGNPVKWDPAIKEAEGRERSTSTCSGGAARSRRASSFGSFTKIVAIAVDSSDDSRYAFEWYIANMWSTDDLLILINCPEAPKLPTFSLKSGISPPVDEWQKILSDMNLKARKIEEDYEGTCTQKKIKYKMRCEAMKNVGEGIVKIAMDEGADIIICGSRGTGGTKFGKRGSVADYVSRNSPIPILIVPQK